MVEIQCKIEQSDYDQYRLTREKLLRRLVNISRPLLAAARFALYTLVVSRFVHRRQPRSSRPPTRAATQEAQPKEEQQSDAPKSVRTRPNFVEQT